MAHASVRTKDHLSAGTVGDVGRGHVDHQETPVRIDDDMALAPNELLAGIVTLVVT